jgi:hypothetical protein
MAVERYELTADTDTLIHTCDTGKVDTVNVSFCAKSANAAIRLAHTGGSTPAATDYLEYGRTLAAADSFERTGIYMTAGEKLYARASASGVSVVVTGPRENA